MTYDTPDQSVARRVGCFVLLAFVLVLTPACTAQREELETYLDYRGAWLRTEAAEVFVAVEPELRVLSLRRPGEETMLNEDETIGALGVRLAVMEPNQHPESYTPGAQMGAFTQRDDGSATVRLNPGDGLRYEVLVELWEDQPRMDLVYRLFNESAEARTVAPWSMSSFALDGRMVVPTGEQPRARKQMILPFWAQVHQEGLKLGLDAMTLAAAPPSGNVAFKMGVITDAGWIAFVRGDRGYLSRATFDAEATYPENGANVSLFTMQKDEKAWAEMEQMGPLRKLAPGEKTELHELITLIELPDAAAEPDELRKQIEAAVNLQQ